LKQAAANYNAVAIPAPTKAIISSFTSYQKLILRGGVAAGGQSLQDIVDFAENFDLTHSAVCSLLDSQGMHTSAMSHVLHHYGWYGTVTADLQCNIESLLNDTKLIDEAS
jgi:hypothetical protein